MRTSFATALFLAAAVCHAAPTTYGSYAPVATVLAAEPVAYVPVALPVTAAPVPTYASSAPAATTPAPVVPDAYQSEVPAEPKTAAATQAEPYAPASEPVEEALATEPVADASASEPVPATDNTYEESQPVAAAATEATGSEPSDAAIYEESNKAYSEGEPVEPTATEDDGSVPTDAATWDEPEPSSTPLPANGTWVAPMEHKCSVTPEGFEPKEMSVKKGETVIFQMTPGEYSIRKGKDASSCAPLDAPQGSNSTALNSTEPALTNSTMTSMTYTVPMNASGKVYFYNVKGDKCVDGDMMATLTVSDNLVANSTSGNSTTAGVTVSAAATSTLPMVALVGAISFIGSFAQL